MGHAGRIVNGIGGICTVLLCLTGSVIWWPGIGRWRSSLTVSWGAHFPRISWDLHSALGFWCVVFVALWGVSGIYLAIPQMFNGRVPLHNRRYSTCMASPGVRVEPGSRRN